MRASRDATRSPTPRLAPVTTAILPSIEFNVDSWCLESEVHSKYAVDNQVTKTELL
jgi:hypothetical protein